METRIPTWLLLLFMIWTICISTCGYAQPSEYQNKSITQNNLRQAIRFVEYNKNDSALYYLEPLWEQIVAQGETDTYLGMQVQLTRARAFEQKHNHSKAFLLFNELKDKSKSIQQWDIYASTCLFLTELHEKLHRLRLSKEHLDNAKIAITQHQLDSLYPSLYIRQAIWNYKFRQHPDTCNYYIQKALSLDTKTDSLIPRLRFSLYMIKGMLITQKDYRVGIEWYKKASLVARELRDPVRLSTIWNIITLAYRDVEKDFDKALAYNDSTIITCYQAIADGHEGINTLHEAYKARSTLYRNIGQIDSAYLYQGKGLNQELVYIKKRQYAQVAEVDARYRDEQKTILLQDQAKTIRYEQRIRKLLIAFFVASLLLVGGLILGLISHRRSIRKLAQQNKLIQQQSEQLQSLDTAKSRFFANVSHELRTPLTLVLGPIKTALKSGSLNNRNFTLLTMARQNAQNLLELVGSILDLSRMEHGKLLLEEKPENLFILIRRIVSAFESHAQREGIELTFHYKAEKDLRLKLDRLKLKDILNNLLSNSIKFTDDGGKIEVVTVDKGNAILISVKDTGRGITSNDLPRVFDRFYQSEEENALTEGGTGIGLAYCKELTAIMGGQIWVESQVREGSIFYIELPRKEVLGIPLEDMKEEGGEEEPNTFILPVTEITPKDNAHLLIDSDRPTVLVVEDNYSLRDYLTTILESYYNVVTARNGNDALQLLDQMSDSPSPTRTKPSLIISDVMMPVMDGFQLMEKLKADDRYNRLPLIMLTARADIRDKLKALRIGVDDYLVKPFDEEEVLVRISNLLENYAIRNEAFNENTAPIKKIPTISEQDSQWLESFETYVQEILSNEMINIPELARQFAMSESTLLRQLKFLTGMTPAKYVQEMRLDKARQLLEQHVYKSVSQIAKAVGYKDPRSFSRSFKKRFGKSPSEYLRTSAI
ncbi:MAG: ATP-binding protein [Saprospiraceae bacterium]|nr:ATP-binding protein [Saprospiraceae bacterium]